MPESPDYSDAHEGVLPKTTAAERRAKNRQWEQSIRDRHEAAAAARDKT